MSDSDGDDHHDVLSWLRSGLELAEFAVDDVEYDAEDRSISLRYVLTLAATASVTDKAVASRVLDGHVSRLARVFHSAVNDARNAERYRRLLVYVLDPPEVSASDERHRIRLEIEAEVAHEWSRRETAERLAPLYRRVADSAALIDPDGDSENVHLQLDID